MLSAPGASWYDAPVPLATMWGYPPGTVIIPGAHFNKGNGLLAGGADMRHGAFYADCREAQLDPFIVLYFSWGRGDSRPLPAIRFGPVWPPPRPQPQALSPAAAAAAAAESLSAPPMSARQMSYLGGGVPPQPGALPARAPRLSAAASAAAAAGAAASATEAGAVGASVAAGLLLVSVVMTVAGASSALQQASAAPPALAFREPQPPTIAAHEAFLAAGASWPGSRCVRFDCFVSCCLLLAACNAPALRDKRCETNASRLRYE